MKIALTYTGFEEKHQNYLRWLQAENDIEIVTISTAENNVAVVADCDALVLAGGRDIHPKFYGETELAYANAPEDFDVDRDELEMAAFLLAQKAGLPVLGVCRGLQLVNCVFNGTLKQDLGEAFTPLHKARPEGDEKHSISIVQGTVLSQIAGTEQTVVNSAHHQAVDKLGTGLRINCFSEEGEVEGLEWADRTGKPFLLCVQWHPERMFKYGWQDEPASKGIQTRFIAEIHNRKMKS